MTVGSLLSTFAAFIGFGASIFFIIGSIRIDKESILELATPCWDYHSGIARTHSEQKWFYTSGAILLILAFIAQTISLAPLESNSAIASRSPVLGFIAAGVLAIAIWAAGYFLCKSMINKTVQAVDKMSDDRIKEHEKELAERSATKSH